MFWLLLACTVGTSPTDNSSSNDDDDCVFLVCKTAEAATEYHLQASEEWGKRPCHI